MDPLSVTASIISVLHLSSKVVLYLTDVKDASKERARCAIEASNLHSLLLNLRFRLEEGTANATPWYKAVQDLAVQNGPLEQFKRALETLDSKMTDGGRLRRAGEALVWKFKKEEITSILDHMERLKSLVEIALQMDHFKLSQAIKADTDFVRTHVPVIQSGVENIQLDHDLMKQRRLLDWISLTDYPAQQSDIIKRRQQGTGQWFLAAPEVTQWLHKPRSTLFCPGIPGAGKTMVAAITIDHLLKWARNHSHGVAYVYCNYKTEKQDASSMLAAILKQLVQGCPSEIEPLERLHQQHADRGTKPSLDEIYSALRDVLARYSAAYIVIDALDECQDSDGTRRQFLAKLRELQEGRDVRLMATSRFIPEIEDDFGDALRCEIQASKEDVKCFVAGQIYRLPRCIQRDAALQEIVQEKIVEAVDGMFLLARLHTDSLLDKRTAKDVKSTLAKFAKGAAALEDAYKEALQRIEGQLEGDYQLAKKVLSWITFAKRPLTTTEICCALAVEPYESKLDPEQVPDKQDLVSVCAGLVVIDEESAIIRLVHYTTQEYFEQIRDTWNPDAQLYMATACLTYLSFDVFKTGSCSTEEELLEKLRQNEFLDYTAKHWGQHASLVETDAEIASLASSFLLQSSLLASATQTQLALNTGLKVYSKHDTKTTPLHCTSAFGLRGLTENFLLTAEENITDVVNAKDGLGQCPLTLAAEHGHWEMAALLLDKGANVNGPGGHYGSPLQAASSEGHELVVKLLLDKGADVNKQGGTFGNALQAASSIGHQQVVKLLLDNGANVNEQGGYCGSALQAACGEGHEQVVKLLLDRGANPNAQGGSFGNALHAALQNYREGAISALLQKGADVSALGGYYGSALQAASYGGHESIVKMLLKMGADVNVLAGQYGNALQAASYRGHEQIVKLLLDNGADANAQGGHYGNAAQAASYIGHIQILQLLLDNGADVNEQGGFFGNSLQAASSMGNEQVAELLLDHGADINEQDGIFGNALQAALYGNREHIVKLLLDKGANINIKGAGSGDALQVASYGGHEGMVKLLLDKGADPNAKGGMFDNSLYAALNKGHAQVVKLLLDHGADVNAKGGDYGNVLQAASFKGHEQVVKVLLDNGAHVNAQGGLFGNALQAASSRGHRQVVKLLLDMGADISVQGGYYGNSLLAASYGGHEEVLKLLLENGADVKLKNFRGETAVSVAAFQGYTTILHHLLSLPGVTPHSPDRFGRTILWWAAAGGQAVIVNLLLNRYKLDPRETDQWGRTPLWIARKKGHDAVSKILYEEYAKVDPKTTNLLDQVISSESSKDESTIECDICTSRVEVNGSRYHCSDCAGGDWDICEDCKMSGASCLDVMHTLVRRTMKDGVWVDEAS